MKNKIERLLPEINRNPGRNLKIIGSTKTQHTMFLNILKDKHKKEDQIILFELSSENY